MIEHTKQNRINNFIKGISIVGIYFILSFFKTMPLEILNINYENLSIIVKELYSLFLELVMIMIVYITFKSEIKKAWTDLKQNHMKYFSETFKYYLLGLLLMFGSNLLINLLGGGISGNETAIRDQFKLAPIFTYISAVFLAPILEESIFRLSFRGIFKNNLLFIITSGLVFGGLHLIAGIDMNLLFLYLISYCSFGIIFAYIFIKTNNIFVSIGFHLMHNGILMTLQLLLYLFA